MTRSRYRDDAFAVTPRTRTRQTNAMQVDGQMDIQLRRCVTHSTSVPPRARPVRHARGRRRVCGCVVVVVVVGTLRHVAN